MIRGHRLMTMFAIALAACGGARPVARTSTEGGPSATQRAERADEAEAFPLDRPRTVPGTGVRIRTPRGSQRSAMGSTFIHPRRRIQIVVAAADGDLSVHQQFRAGLRGDAETIDEQDVELDGAPATLVVDRLAQGETELERVWVLARRGTRSVAAMGVYAADRSESLRGLVRASVLSTRFDDRVAVDPEAAVGWRVAGVEGLRLVRTASTNVSYSIDGRPPPGGTTDPLLFMMPIPVALPDAERAQICSEVLAQLVHLPDGQDVERAPIDAGEVQGCEIAGMAGGTPALATYAALVFRGEAAFMVAGTAGSREPWIARFRAAARTLEPVESAPDPAEEEPRDAPDDGDETGRGP